MAEVVGTAYVRIRAITTKLSSDISDAVNRGAADADTDIKDAGERSGRSFGESFSETVTDKVSETLRDGISDNDRDSNTFKRFGHSMAGLFHRSFRSSSDNESGNTGTSLKKNFSKIFKALEKFQLPLPFWLTPLGIGALAGAAKLAIYYIGGIVGYIGTLVQIGVAGGAVLGAAFLAVGAGAGILMAAFKAQTPELEAFKQGVTGINNAWKEMIRGTQRELFPRLTDAYRTLSYGLLPVFNEMAPVVGRVAGDVAKMVASTLTSGPAIKMWEGFSQNVGYISAGFGRIINALARMFIPLMETLNPLALDFAFTLTGIVEKWADLLDKSKASGSLKTFFETGYAKAKQFMGALGDILAGLWNIMQIGSQEIGMSAFDTFDSFAQRFRDFTRSLEGQNQIRKFFQEAKPVMEEVNGLMRDILVLFGQDVINGTGSANIVSTLQLIRNDLVPAIHDSLKGLSGAMSQANFEEFITVVGDLVTAIFELQFLTPALQAITFALEALVAVLNTPIVGPIVKYLFVLGTIAGFAAKFLGPVMPLLSMLGRGIAFVATALANTGPGMAFFGTIAGWLAGIGPLLAKIGGIIASVVGAITSGPVLLVVGIIAGVVAAITGLYFAFDGVRNVVDSFWESLMNVWDIITNFSFGRLGELAMALLEIWIRVFTTMPHIIWEALWGIGELILKFFSNLPGWLMTALKFVGSLLWGWIQDAAPVVLQTLVNLGSTILGWVMELPGKIWEFIQLAIPALVSWISAAIPKILYALGYALGFIIGWTIRLPIVLGTLLVQAGIALWNWIVDVVPTVLEKLVGLAESVWGWVTGFISEIPGKILGAADAIWSWIKEAVPKLAEKWVEFQEAMWTTIANFITEIPGHIADAANKIWDWIQIAVDQGPSKLMEVANTIKDWATSLPGKIVEWIGDIGGTMLDIGKSIVEGIWNGISNMGDWIKDKIGDFAGGLIDGIKGAFGIGSPAKKVYFVGEAITQGVGVGITRGQTALNKQIAGIYQPSLYVPDASRGINSGSTMTAASTAADAIRLLAAGQSADVRVYIGDKELTDMIDVRVEQNSRDDALMLIGRGM